MAKKIAVEDPVPVEDRHVKIIARVARMQLFREQNPEAETDTYDESIEDYKYLWRKIPKANRAAVIEAATRLPDMDKELVKAAMAVLEPTNGRR